MCPSTQTRRQIVGMTSSSAIRMQYTVPDFDWALATAVGLLSESVRSQITIAESRAASRKFPDMTPRFAQGTPPGTRRGSPPPLPDCSQCGPLCGTAGAFAVPAADTSTGEVTSYKQLYFMHLADDETRGVDAGQQFAHRGRKADRSGQSGLNGSRQERLPPAAKTSL